MKLDGFSGETMSAGTLWTGLSMALLFFVGTVLNLQWLWRQRHGLLCIPRRGFVVLRARPWTGRDAVAILLPLSVAFGVTWAVGWTVQNFSPSVAPPLFGVMIGVNLLLQGLAVRLVWRQMHRRGGWRLCFGGYRHRRIRLLFDVLRHYAGCLPWVVAGASFSIMMADWGGWDIGPQPAVGLFVDRQTPSAIKAMLVIMAVFTAPLAEELVFRGVLLPVLSRWNGTIPAIVMVSMLFAAIHGHPPTFLPLMAVGIGLALAYLRTETLLAPLGFHALFNAVNLGVALLAGDRFGAL